MDESFAFRQSLLRRLLLAASTCGERVVSVNDGAPGRLSALSAPNPVDGEGDRVDDLCCYDVTKAEDNGDCVLEGRPLRIAGAPRTARAARGRPGWGDRGATALPDCSGLTDDAREALAAHWTRAALMEHASIAEFSRCSLDLLAVGAPADLVTETNAAALDEIRHARASFVLASAYAGEPVGPLSLPLGGGVELRADFAAVAAAAARDGCVNETLAALLAAEQLSRATDPAVRAVLAMLAEDEARHAELAWRTVRWALEAGGEPVRRAVYDAFAAAQRGAEGKERLVEADDDDALLGHGRLTVAAVRRVHARALAEVVMPCAEALLGRPLIDPRAARA